MLVSQTPWIISSALSLSCKPRGSHLDAACPLLQVIFHLHRQSSLLHLHYPTHQSWFFQYPLAGASFPIQFASSLPSLWAIFQLTDLTAVLFSAIGLLLPPSFEVICWQCNCEF